MSAHAGEYVLGTHDAEVARLGVQHQAWRETVLEAWRRAGLQTGDRAIDVGAGPGWATWDLAEAVGPTGEVLAVERSERFVSVLKQETAHRGLRNVAIRAADLMDLSSAPHTYDLAWCRWVASFTSSVPQLVRWVREALRPGGVGVFHEYLDYASWRFAPPRPHLQEFVSEVMASWRASGGEPDAAPSLVAALRTGGFRLRGVRPLVFAAKPGELIWQWPAGFVATNVARLQELGRVRSEWGDAVLRDLAEAEADADSVMITPMVLEIIAERE
jgi:ubiquinone/menaquinone biosynthesis C-methylase UbiE